MKRYIKDGAAIIVGSVLFAIGLCVFAEPCNISTGGASGLALIISKFTGLGMGVLIFIINTPLLIATHRICGLRYTLKTLYTTFMFSLITECIDRWVSVRYTQSKTIAAVMGGLLIGLGIYVILRRQLVTGGSDLLAYLINHRQPARRIGSLLLIIDGVIVVIGAVVFKNIGVLLYSLILISITAATVNKLLGGQSDRVS